VFLIAYSETQGDVSDRRHARVRWAKVIRTLHGGVAWSRGPTWCFSYRWYEIILSEGGSFVTRRTRQMTTRRTLHHGIECGHGRLRARLRRCVVGQGRGEVFGRAERCYRRSSSDNTFDDVGSDRRCQPSNAIPGSAVDGHTLSLFLGCELV
jgi:hypothetical protein